MKNMGAVIQVPSMRCEIAAKTRRTTASATSCQCTGGASQRAKACWQGRFERCPSGMPTIVVDEALVRALLAEQFPELDASLRADCSARAGTTRCGSSRSEWAFRFPRRADRDRRRRAASSRCCRDSPRSLPLPIPEPRLRRATERALPLAVLRRVAPSRRRAARCADALIDDRASARSSAPCFGRFLRRCSTTSDLDRGACQSTPNRRADMPFRVASRAVGRLAEARRPALTGDRVERDPQRGRSGCRRPRDPKCSSTATSIIRHVLVDEGRLAGVIDWGDVCVGDPVDRPAARLDAPSARRARALRRGVWSGRRRCASCEHVRLALFFCAMLASYARASATRTSSASPSRHSSGHADRLVGDAAFENRREPRGVDVPARDDAHHSPLTRRARPSPPRRAGRLRPRRRCAHARAAAARPPRHLRARWRTRR